MNACRTERCSVNGLTTALVAKQNSNPKNMEIGKAGNAFRHIANNSSVKHKPCNSKTMQKLKLNWINSACILTYNQNCHKASNRRVPVAIARCFANKYRVKYKIAQTKFDATLFRLDFMVSWCCWCCDCAIFGWTIWIAGDVCLDFHLPLLRAIITGCGPFLCESGF